MHREANSGRQQVRQECASLARSEEGACGSQRAGKDVRARSNNAPSSTDDLARTEPYAAVKAATPASSLPHRDVPLAKRRKAASRGASEALMAAPRKIQEGSGIPMRVLALVEEGLAP